MTYQTTVNHKEIATEIASSALNLAGETREIMTEKLAPFLLEGEQMPDAGLLQELLGRFLLAHGEGLAVADDDYSREVRGHREVQHLYLERMAEVRRCLRDVRHAVDRVFGVKTSKLLLGTRDFTSRQAPVLVGLARKAAQALREPSHFFEPDPATGLGASSARLADELERVSTALAAISDKKLLEQRYQRKIKLNAKEERLASAKEAISDATAVLKGFYQFTGNSFHIKRLRTRPRRRKAALGEAAQQKPMLVPPKSEAK